jgi:integrase/recombinase XerD|nr:MAG TPA: Integrase [Caudoviricetes sp.]
MKRANGSGSIVKLSGNRRRPYMVRVSARDEYGHIVQRALSYHEKAADAQAALDEYNRNRLEGKAPTADRMNATLQQVYDGWKSRTFRKSGSSSVTSHKAAWNQCVKQYADRKIRSITLDDWQQLIDEREAAGRSQSTINNVSILIKALCSYAMERDILGKDYSRYLDVPSVDPKKPRGALTDIQLKNLEKLAAAGEPWADTALILCYTGFRITEFLTLTRFSYHPEDGGYLQGGLKTEAGRNRIVPIHPKIRPYVDRWLARNGDTIFCDDDGAHLPAARYREYFAVIMAKIDAPQATPHWCRHTFSTNLHAAGVDEITIKWLMGHSTRSDITAHYTHETIAVLRAAVRKVA